MVELAAVRVIWQLCVLLNNFNRNTLLTNFLMVNVVSEQFFVYIICCVTLLGGIGLMSNIKLGSGYSATVVLCHSCNSTIGCTCMGGVH